MKIKPCFVLPVYNHPHYLHDLIAFLTDFNLPIVLVDDGSDEQCKQVISTLSSSQLTVLQHEKNQGKGQAVMTGLHYADQQGFSHALQIDVDGQHTWQDVGKFLKIAEQYPHKMIIGKPIYGSDVPKKRLYGRYATHIWVWINSLSFQIHDSMCGFRVYPLAETVQILKRHRLRKRMGFDSEILVYLSWSGVSFVNVPTPVIYPEHGISHFRMWDDNLELSKMHASLFFGMLWRLPQLLWQKLTRNKS